jgi:hypothetical protein
MDFDNFMRSHFGSAWAYLLGFTIVIVWGIISKISNRNR